MKVSAELNLWIGFIGKVRNGRDYLWVSVTTDLMSTEGLSHQVCRPGVTADNMLAF
jgi:hypothetical protein